MHNKNHLDLYDHGFHYPEAHSAHCFHTFGVLQM